MYCWSKIQIVIILVLLITPERIIASSNAEINRKNFEVKTVIGEVHYRTYTDAYWKQLTMGEKLDSSALLKVKTNSGVDLEYSIEGVQTIIRITTPTVMRLDNNFKRETENREYVLSQLPKFDKKPSLKKSLDFEPQKFIAKAYNRIKLITLGAKDVQSDSRIAPTKAKDLVTTLSKKLAISYPPKNGVITSPTRENILVFWEHFEEELDFDVFLWDTKESNKTYLGRTNKSMYKLPKLDYGQHAIEISSTNGVYKSEIIPFRLEDPKKIIHNHISEKPTTRQKISSEIFENIYGDLFPPKDFILLSDSNRSNFRFWYNPKGESKLVAIKVRKNGQEKFEEISIEDLKETRLADGSWEWQAIIESRDNTKIESSVHNLQIFTLNDSDEMKGQVSKVLNNQFFDETIYITD